MANAQRYSPPINDANGELTVVLRTHSNLDMDLIRLIKRHYIANPLTYVYLFYDLMYYPEVTEFYLNINGSDITGFVLIWHSAWGPRRGCSSVHVYGSVNGVEGLIPTDECLEAHMVASSEITGAVIKRLGEMGPVKHRRFLTMACWGSVFRDYRNPLIGARRLSIDDAVDLARVKAEQGTPLDPGEVILRLASPHWHYYGAFVNGELASIATTYLKLPEVWVIGDVYTRARYRGIGAGKAVTAAVTKDALTSGAMAMLHVDEDNEPAVRVYRRIGYRVVRVEDWLASSPF